MDHTHTRLPTSRAVALLPNPIAASPHPSKRKQRNKLENKHQSKSTSKQSHGPMVREERQQTVAVLVEEREGLLERKPLLARQPFHADATVTP
jgi:hypothetical protein